MTLTVDELQDYMNLYYPDNRDFSALLCYWKNEVVKWRLESKRLNHQHYKDLKGEHRHE